jgi:UDP-N-acetyl-2-amino-2-deoxyglucuronate dehydrogenase
VAEVQARADTLDRTIEVEDCVAATLRFTSGALGSIVATTAAAPGFPHRVEVYGTQGGVQIEGEAVVRWSMAAGERVAGAVTPQAAGAGAAPGGISAIGHARILADFVDAVRVGRDPLVSGEEARRALAVVLAVYQAARSGVAVRVG